MYGWRVPFAVVAVPSLVLAPLFYFITEDPKRGNAEKALRLDDTTVGSFCASLLASFCDFNASNLVMPGLR